MADLEQLPAQASISFVRGDDYELDVEVQDEFGNPIDFSSWSNEKIEVRELEKNGGNLLATYNVGTDITTTAGGRVQATFPQSDTESWTNNYVEYEMQGDDGNGNNRSILRGPIELVREISEG